MKHIKDRKIIVCPDADAYDDVMNANGHLIKGWVQIAKEYRQLDYHIRVSDELQSQYQQRGLPENADLADVLLLEVPPWAKQEPLAVGHS
ncbi:hypothetical protein RZS08_58060, partial [Arthrospira platensis SPKY1]|nr:hypothetical protein [Arthrospira platensis SPKY1]